MNNFFLSVLVSRFFDITGLLSKGCSNKDPLSADLRYGEEDSSSPSTLIFSAIKGLLGIYTLYIPPDVPKKLALR